METNSIGAYSPDVVYGQLSAPFMPKTITVNAHTPLDKENTEEGDVSYSQSSFYVNIYPRVKVTIGKNETKEIPLEVKAKEDAKSVVEAEFQTNDIKTEISNFSASKLSSQDIVNNSLKLGYSTDEAMIMCNAQRAYEKSSLITNTPAKTLSTRSYEVF